MMMLGSVKRNVLVEAGVIISNDFVYGGVIHFYIIFVI